MLTFDEWLFAIIFEFVLAEEITKIYLFELKINLYIKKQ